LWFDNGGTSRRVGGDLSVTGAAVTVLNHYTGTGYASKTIGFGALMFGAGNPTLVVTNIDASDYLMTTVFTGCTVNASATITVDDSDATNADSTVTISNMAVVAGSTLTKAGPNTLTLAGSLSVRMPGSAGLYAATNFALVDVVAGGLTKNCAFQTADELWATNTSGAGVTVRMANNKGTAVPNESPANFSAENAGYVAVGTVSSAQTYLVELDLANMTPDVSAVVAELSCNAGFLNVTNVDSDTVSFAVLPPADGTVYLAWDNVVNSLKADVTKVSVSSISLAPIINNTNGASNVQATSATLNGTLTSAGGAGTLVYVYWGPTDGTNNASAWANSTFLGTNSAVCPVQYASDVSGLDANRTYYYRYFATNSYGGSWAGVSACFTTALATAQFALADSSGSEATAATNIVVTLSAPSGADVSINYAVFASSTATGSGVDYTLTNGVVVIPAGYTSTSIPLGINNDALDEYDETIVVGLTGVTGATLGTLTNHTYTISDDDATPTLSINDPGVVEGNTGTTNANFTVALSAASGRAVSFDFASADGTAHAGSDYAATNGALTIPAGQSSVTLTVAVNGDFADEGVSETFCVNLTNVVNAVVSKAQGQCTIADDDVPALAISDAAVPLPECGTASAIFTVSLSETGALDLAVDFTTSNGTAVAGTDYVATNGTLTIPAGQMSGAITVVVNGSADNEAIKDFRVVLSNPVNASLADGQGMGTITALYRWPYKMRITFPGYGKTETLTNFPALVVLNETLANFRYVQFASTNGYDLRFADSSETQILNHEIEDWDTAGNSHVWVQVPELSGTNTSIWAYWGNVNATDRPMYTTNGAAWDADYKGVWHFNESGTGIRYDSTENTNNAAPQNYEGDEATNGVAGGADRLDGNNDYLLISDPALGTNDFTFSGWGLPNTTNGIKWILATTASGDASLGQMDNKAMFEIGASFVTGTTAVANGNWRYFAGTRKGGVCRLYLDGVQEEDFSNTGNTSGGTVTIGARGTGSRWNGAVDEVRVSSTARSSNWIWTTWFNLVSNAFFTAYSEVEIAEGVMFTLVPGVEGGGVTNDFHVSLHEITVGQYVLFLNAQTNGEIAVSNGQVRSFLTSDLLCLTSDTDNRSYVGGTCGNFNAVAERAGHPMVFVSWFGAAAYCNWKSAQDGLVPVYDPTNNWSAIPGGDGYRLPTEAEWRKAAAWDANAAVFRAYGTGSDGISAGDANYLNSGDGFETNVVRTCPIGAYPTLSAYGLRDASGNVWEWCQDFYDAAGSNPSVDPHAVRGGGWGNLSRELSAGTRGGNKPGQVKDSVGFRIVSTATRLYW
jgi:formylglycine-generating enzyme required for sulfatase activity